MPQPLLQAIPEELQISHHDNATDGIEFLVAEFQIEVLVELFNRREGVDQSLIIFDGANEGIFFVGIKFIFNFADDFFQHVFNGDQAGNESIEIADLKFKILTSDKRRIRILQVSPVNT